MKGKSPKTVQPSGVCCSSGAIFQCLVGITPDGNELIQCRNAPVKHQPYQADPDFPGSVVWIRRMGLMSSPILEPFTQCWTITEKSCSKPAVANQVLNDLGTGFYLQAGSGRALLNAHGFSHISPSGSVRAVALVNRLPSNLVPATHPSASLHPPTTHAAIER